MDLIPNGLILVLLGLALAFFISAIVAFYIQHKYKKWRTLSQKLVYPALFLIFSIFLLRFMVSTFDSPLSESKVELSEQSPELNIFENILNSFVLTFQTFSLDEEYTQTIIDGKKIFMDCSWGKWTRLLQNIYGGLTALTNILAPVIFTAFLLALLISIFPIFRYNFSLKKKYYVFSELNERAIHLAENIMKIAEKENNKKFWKMPLIVFTDAYTKEHDEKTTELFQRAKEINAVCVKDDLKKLPFKHDKILHYFLLDNETKDNSNIHDLTTLITKIEVEKIVEKIKNECIIYVFSKNPELSRIVKSLYNDLYQNNIAEKGGNIIIQVAQEYTSIVYDLFEKVPLYLPLLKMKKENKKELVVTIIGGGKIGTEAFLGAYWCGQMLDCKLRINVITEKFEKFIESINHINPEILESGEIIENKFKQIKKIFKREGFNKSKYSEPYAKFSFMDANVETGKFKEIICDDKFSDNFSIIDSDYFIVALGTDELNLTTASDIDRIVRRKRLNSKMPTIAYSIYHSETYHVMNGLDEKNKSRTLHAFAAQSEIYKYNNISMMNKLELAYKIDHSHSATYMKKFRGDEYSFWSSLARVYHFPYKIFSVEKNSEKSLFDDNSSDAKIHVMEKYFDCVDKNPELEKELAWLEHRRWNAFMRTKGFIAPCNSDNNKQLENYAFKDDFDHKNLDIKLHPYIVERSRPSEKNREINDDDWEDQNEKYKKDSKLDDLDKAMIGVYRIAKKADTNKAEDFIREGRREVKRWDLPKEDLRILITQKFKDTIETEKQLKKAYEEVVRDMEIFFSDFRINKRIKIRLTDAKKIAKLSGKKYDSTSEFDERTLAFANKTFWGSYIIYLEKGVPKIAAMVNIVHELTLIWQNISWNNGNRQLRDYGGNDKEMLAYEGMAMWAEIRFLYSLNEKSYARWRDGENNKNRQDVYERGYSEFKEQYPPEKSDTKKSPFENKEPPYLLLELPAK